MDQWQEFKQSRTFAEVFEQLRLTRGWSPAEVARRLEVYPTEVSRWRHGRGGISIRNVRKVADLFGVDRTELERLAGYGDSSLGDTADTLDPEMAALLDAERAEVHETLGGIDKLFWPTIFEAQRTARRLAVQVAQELQARARSISNPEAGQISNPADPRRKRGPGSPRAPGGDKAGVSEAKRTQWQPSMSPVA